MYLASRQTWPVEVSFIVRPGRLEVEGGRALEVSRELRTEDRFLAELGYFGVVLFI